ncbi:unnamed protein product [Pylaiella littoralis]
MHLNIFLDARCAAGDVGLFKTLQRKRMPLLKQSLFLAALSRHTNEVSVPLSMFQKFTYEKGGKLKDTIDLKVRAVALINNIVRIYALAGGISVPHPCKAIFIARKFRAFNQGCGELTRYLDIFESITMASSASA